jgi:hypothetical protein
MVLAPTALSSKRGKPRGGQGGLARARTNKKNGYTQHDLPKIMADIELEKMAAEAAAAAATRAAGWKKGPHGDDLGIPNNDLLALILLLIEEYVWVTAEERIACALLALHTYVFRQFRHAPRLFVISPIEEGGKTTLLQVIEQLAYEPDRVGGTTAAAIYHQLEDTPGITLVIDEADNLDLFNDPKMRQLFNYGHEVDGAIRRFIGGRSRRYIVGSPLVLGTISSPTAHVPINHRQDAPITQPAKTVRQVRPRLHHRT